ncbi:Papain inhibitor [Tolypocladium capitatum]|uniref:Papain inhibitor n=1 Tax=Tolypocladium capitatum TaxID=45235 RepID=A0A2K3QA05_9HYPO|nr:Papain inhibitor [Tolypocladium capitatum]
MVAFITALAALSAIFSTAIAAPAQDDSTHALETRANRGRITHYNPGVGFGACGWRNSDAEFVVAVGHALYDAQHPCNRKIRVSYQGRSAVVRVVDRCGGCGYNDIDLSPAAFRNVIGNLDIGVVTTTWEWV